MLGTVNAPGAGSVKAAQAVISAEQAVKTAGDAQQTASEAYELSNEANQAAAEALRIANEADHTATTAQQAVSDLQTLVEDLQKPDDTPASDYMPLSGGSFTGKVYAGAGMQPAEEYMLRNVKLSLSEETPSAEGHVCLFCE